MDIWRLGIARQPIADIIANGRITGPVTWVQEKDPCRFLADPFGIERDGILHVFAEAYDYRTRKGQIDVLRFDSAMRLLSRVPCLREPWHLSYPALIEWEGETWLLPEAHRSGRLTLYRAIEFPDRWEAAAVIDLPDVPVDATPLFHDGRWWLFYAPARSKSDKTGHLHIAFADRLTGSWRAHPLNPVRVDPASSRTGGTPTVVNGEIILPVQDCSQTYGGAIRALHISLLTETAFEAQCSPAIGKPFGSAPFDEGLHTLSGCGAFTLFDVKKIDRSLSGSLAGLRGRVRRAARQFRVLRG
jgi:hypothetical protein